MQVLLPSVLQAQETDPGQVSVVVSPTHHNWDFLYCGIENPLEVAVPGVDCAALNISVSQGTGKGSGCSYSVTPSSTGALLFLTVKWEQHGKMYSASREFWVRPLPLPVPFYAGVCYSDTVIGISDVKAGAGVFAKYVAQRLDDMGYQYERPEMKHYRVSIVRDCTTVFSGESRAGSLPTEIKEALQQVQINDVVEISDIRIVERGELQALAGIRVKVK